MNEPHDCQVQGLPHWGSEWRCTECLQKWESWEEYDNDSIVWRWVRVWDEHCPPRVETMRLDSGTYVEVCRDAFDQIICYVEIEGEQ